MADPTNELDPSQTDISQDQPARAPIGLELQDGPDPEDLALQEALAAEKGTEPAGDIDPPEEGTEPQQAPPPAAPAADPKSDQQRQPAPQPMIPKARFDEERIEGQKWRDQALILEGQNQALQALLNGRAPTADAAPPPEPEPQVDPLQVAKDKQATAISALQSKYDNAEIDGPTYAKELAQINSEFADGIVAAVNATRPAAPAPVQPAASVADKMIEEDFNNRLVAAHPYLNVLDQSHLASLSAMVDAQWKADGTYAAMRGQPKAAIDMRFRQDVSALTDFFGPKWRPDFKPPVHQPGAKPGAQPQPSADQRRQKLDRAQAQPPDISSIGKGGDHVSITEDALQNMAPHELENLPDAVLNRFMGNA